MATTLYGTPISTYVRTARLALESANVDYSIQDIGIFNGDNTTDEYLSKQPFGKIPTLEIDGTQIYETNAITHYVNEKYANGKLSPADVLLQARMHQIISIVNSYLYAPAVGALTIENLVAPSQGKAPNKEKIEAAIAPTQKALSAIESLMTGKKYLLSSLSLADFYLIPIFVYISKTPQYETATADVTTLKTWWDSAQTLDIVKKVCS